MFKWIKDQFAGKDKEDQKDQSSTDQDQKESIQDDIEDQPDEKISEDLEDAVESEVDEEEKEDTETIEESDVSKVEKSSDLDDETSEEEPAAETEDKLEKDITEEAEPVVEEVVISEKIEETEPIAEEVIVTEEPKEEKSEPEVEEPEAVEESVEEISEPIIEEPVEPEEPKEEKVGFFQKIFSGLERTRNDFSDKLGMILGSYIQIDEDMYEDLEDILITADIGVDTTMELIDNLRETIKEERITDPQEVVPILAQEAKKLIDLDSTEFTPEQSPTIMLVVGVNGVGKTTTIGKLAAKYKAEGKKVMLVAADTFRAAATEQLVEWSNRAGVEIIAQAEGADPASVVYDGIQAAKARGTDIVLVDTAGRLHNKANLMNELEKIYGIIDREYPEANKESMIVLDATTGQNAITQARQFKEVVDITGVTLTKLDGTAKGGVVLPLIAELQLPVVYIGVGEQIDDLQEFDPDVFIDSIFTEEVGE